MSRPKLKKEDKKTTLGITISKKLYAMIELETNNKSRFIESLVELYFKNKK